MSTCDCYKGVPGDVSYQPLGNIKKEHGFPIYVVSSQRSSGKKGTIIFLPDVFGLALHNIILADLYATKGYDVVILDYLEGDALPVSLMKYTPGTDIETYDEFTREEKEEVRNVNLEAWNKIHSPDHVWPLVVRFMEKLKTASTLASASGTLASQKLYALGHCFGGKYAFKLAQGMNVSAAVAMHPSYLTVEDQENLKCPIFVGCAETDFITPTLIQDMLAALPKLTIQYKFTVYGATKHGFASRADMADETARKVLIDAFEDTVRWIDQY